MKLKNDSTDLELFDYVNELRKQGMFLFVEDKKLKYRIKYIRKKLIFSTLVT